MASSASLVLLASRLKNTRLTRSSRRPLRSRASIVLAKLGIAAAPVITAISALCSPMPLSKAGGKCSGRMRSNGGRPNGVVQVSKNGLSVIGQKTKIFDAEYAKGAEMRRPLRVLRDLGGEVLLLFALTMPRDPLGVG